MANKPNPQLQKAVFGHIKSHILKFGYPPTTRDLMAYTGRNSSSHMHSVLRKLEADGLITMEAGKSRTIRLVGYHYSLTPMHGISKRLLEKYKEAIDAGVWEIPDGLYVDEILDDA